MSLRFKLILPLLFSWLALVVIGFIVYLPHLTEENRAFFISQQHSMLEIVDDDIIDAVLLHDLGRVSSIADRLLKENRNWVSLVISNPDGKTIYPIIPENGMRDSVSLTLEHDLLFYNEYVGRLKVAINTETIDNMSREQVDHTILDYTILGIVVGLMIIWFQEQAISRPIKRLTRASAQLAEGDFNVKLADADKNGGELGALSKAFLQMSEKLSLANKSLQVEALQARESELRALRESEEELKVILENVVDAIFTIDAEGIIVSVNTVACRMFGYLEHELIGKNVSILIPKNSVHRDHDIYIQKYRGGGTPGLIGTNRELQAARKDGDVFPVEITISEFNRHGEPMFVGIVRDIAKQKETEGMLRSAKAAAEHASQMKSRFVANMSHELRTPLNGVLGTLELLKDSSLSPQQIEYLDTAMSAGDSLRKIIDAVLDFSKIETGQVMLEAVRFDPEKLIGDLVRLYSPAASEYKTVLRWNAKTAIPHVCVADELRIRQVISNLIGNAVKFTRGGEVLLELSVMPLDLNRMNIPFDYFSALKRDPDLKEWRWLLIEVVDNGVGIPESRQQAIFQPFTQADVSTTRRFGGTGLGLSISKQLSSLMGGDIALESQEGKGSRFWFRTPIGLIQYEAINDILDSGVDKGQSISETDNNLDGVSVKRRKVLVVEDNLTNQLVLKGMLQKMDFDVDIADNGETALEYLEDNNYVGIFMDVQMPVMDGIETTKRIRMRRDDKRNVLVIGVSADATIEVKTEAIREGMNDYLTKPINLAQLQEVVANNFG